MAEQQPEEIVSEIHDTTTISLGTLPVRRSPDFIRVYGSMVTTSASVFDVSLIFGQALGDNPADAHIEQRVAVTMSWQAAKAFAHLLVSTVSNYESMVGEIRLPSSPQQSKQVASE